ncbi:hypothetical protein PC116_g24248 [Phytophthora cactorum]|nr:hypothetical protein PC116_g24248 [Phytophthora cactorum]
MRQMPKNPGSHNYSSGEQWSAVFFPSTQKNGRMSRGPSTLKRRPIGSAEV